MVFFIPFCIPVEEEGKVFINTSVGILPDADEKMQVITQQAIGKSLRNRADMCQV